MKKILAFYFFSFSFSFSMTQLQKAMSVIAYRLTRNQHTLALIKPHIFKTKDWIEIVKIAEKKGFGIKSMLNVEFDLNLLSKFYFEHKDKPFFISEFAPTMITAPALALILQKNNAVDDWRQLIGDANPKNAIPGTIRNRFGIDINQNAVHGSSTPKAAEREIELIFGLKSLD